MSDSDGDKRLVDRLMSGEPSAIDIALYEATKSGMGIAIFQSEQGFHLGFVDREAITDALGRKDDEGDDYYASAMMCLEGGKLDEAKAGFLKGITDSLVQTWSYARRLFFGGVEDEEE